MEDSVHNRELFCNRMRSLVIECVLFTHTECVLRTEFQSGRRRKETHGMPCLSVVTATHCNTLQHTATHCNTLNTLQHAATCTLDGSSFTFRKFAMNCSALLCVLSANELFIAYIFHIPQIRHECSALLWILSATKPFIAGLFCGK